MKKDEAKRIIAAEGLRNVNWYDDGNLREHQVGIAKGNSEWMVYVTDERASIVQTSVSRISSEEEALDIFIRKARYGMKHFYPSDIR